MKVGSRTDCQADFERGMMEMNTWKDDWYWSDDELEKLNEFEYEIYEMECNEVLKRYAYQE